MLTTEQTPTSVATQTPLCVYCDRPMRPLVADRLGSSELTLFSCEGCGWEVAVPLR